MSPVAQGGRERGFTLIEAMAAVVILSVSLLAMGAFTVSVMRSDDTAQQRTVGTHIAEQVLEQWYSDDVTPTPSPETVNATTYQFQSFDATPIGGIKSANLTGSGTTVEARAVTVYWKNASGVHKVTVTNVQRAQ